MSRTHVRLFLFAGLLSAGLLIGLFAGGRPATVSNIDHTGPTIEQIRGWASLVTTRVSVADVVTAEVSGFGGSITAVLVIKGDARIAIDLDQAVLERVNATDRSVLLVLPQPCCESASVDHDRSRIFAVQRHGLWLLMRRDEASQQAVDAAFASAQQAIVRAGDAPAVIAKARQHAEEIIGHLLGQTGWSAQIRWK